METKRLDISSQEETERWDAFVARDHRAYHLSRWSRVLSSAFEFVPHYLYQERDGEIISVFPLARVRSPQFTEELVSLPHVESAGILNPSYYPDYLDFIRDSVRAKSILIYQGRGPLGSLESNTHEVLFHMDLPDDPQAILSGIPSEVIRKGMKKSLAKGYTVTFGNSPSLRREFYAEYLRKMREFGTPPQGFQYIDSIADAFGDGCVIAVAKDHDKVIGASLDVLYGDHLYKLYFAVLRHELNRKVGYFLEYMTFEHAVMKGVRQVVLGRSAKGSGAFHYKERLGGYALPLHLYNLRLGPSGYSATRRETVKQKFGYASRLWKRLPLGLTAVLGPPIRRFLY